MDYSSNREVEKEFLLREKYNGVKNSEYEADTTRIDDGEPLAYVIGFVPFLDCKIFLDSRPLIPRPETEYWVECAIQEVLGARFQLLGGRKTIKILDLFAGSGCVGVALLKHTSETQVDFGEIDTNHFPTIEKNIRENNIDEKRTNIIHTDVWSGITKKYDLVCANPPYLSESRLHLIEPSVLGHEPRRALFADEDGFALIRKMVAEAESFLEPHGTLYIEHEPEHAQPLKECAEGRGFTVETKQDQYGVLRYSILRRV